MRSRYCSRIFVRKAPRREAHQLKEGHAPRYSGTIAAGENVRAIDENDHAFRKLPGAKLVHSSRGVQIALPGKNARRGEAVSALLKELNAILDFHAPLLPLTRPKHASAEWRQNCGDRRSATRLHREVRTTIGCLILLFTDRLFFGSLIRPPTIGGA
jgi:hypothetical protein